MNLLQKRVMTGAMIVAASVGSIPAFADHHNHHNENWRHYDQNASWDQQRDYYSHNWRNLKAEHRKALDNEMRQEWMSYHHNNYHGSYGWNNYNNPEFLNYLHTSNPSLLTRVSSYLGI